MFGLLLSGAALHASPDNEYQFNSSHKRLLTFHMHGTQW
ncbi:hypothetical protein AT1219_30218 [Vibrio alginolyticus]